MADDLSSAAGALRRSSERLNTITDEAAETVRAVEDFLNEQCSLGVFAKVIIWHAYEPWDDNLYLAYQRSGSRYRIVLRWEPAQATDPEDFTTKPWSECTRDQKLETFAKLPDLLAELSKVVDRRIADARKTMKSVSQALSSFPIDKGSTPEKRPVPRKKGK
jgi:hypothetical protein